MRNAGGYAVWSGPGASVEADTVTCAHCNTVVMIHARQSPSEVGGFCRMCMKHICAPCSADPACKTFEKRLEELEAKARLHRAIGTV